MGALVLEWLAQPIISQRLAALVLEWLEQPLIIQRLAALVLECLAQPLISQRLAALVLEWLTQPLISQGLAASVTSIGWLGQWSSQELAARSDFGCKSHYQDTALCAALVLIITKKKLENQTFIYNGNMKLYFIWAKFLIPKTTSSVKKVLGSLLPSVNQG